MEKLCFYKQLKKSRLKLKNKGPNLKNDIFTQNIYYMAHNPHLTSQNQKPIRKSLSYNL